MASTFYIIDGHSQIYRAYYAPFRDLTSPSGEPVRATYVFCTMLLKFISTKLKEGDWLMMAVDGPAEKLKRREIYDQYKITRKPTPEDFRPQAERIMQIVEAAGIPVVAVEGYEADDIMATAAEHYASPTRKVVLISRDKDLDQLVCENVVLYDPMKDETFDAEKIEQQKGYPPQKAVEIQTLMGDSIDNIPGVPGVGPKTAVKLIQQYGSAENVITHADEQTPKLAENLKAASQTIELSRKLVTLGRDIPLKLDIKQLEYHGLNFQTIREVFVELGFTRLIDQIDKLSGTASTPQPAQKPAHPQPAQGMLFDMGGGSQTPQTQTTQPASAPAPSVPAGFTTAENFKYICIDTPEALDKIIEEMKGIKNLAVDTETDSVNPMQANLVGISLSWKDASGYYIPVKGPLGSKTLDVELLRKKLAPVFCDKNIRKIGQNIKFDLIVLENAGFTLTGEMFDTMLAAYVLDATRGSYKMDHLAMEYLNHRCIPISDLIGTGKKQTKMDTVPTDIAATYAAEDAEVTFRLYEVLDKKLRDEKLYELFETIEMPLMGVLEKMERIGIIVDIETLKKLETEFSKRCDVLRDKIIASAGRQFNPDSPKQLADILFTELKLPIIKKTKTGPSTDSGVLEELTSHHELPELILEYRKLTKLLSTYITALAQQINPRSGRVHTSFRQTGTVTGRLSSSDPNLQNIPVRSEEGKLVRSAFVANEGCLLLSADYSQVELRMLSHFCQDATLIEAFKRDLDIHKAVAAEVFEVPLDEVTPDMRARAKTVNFGIVYGQTAHGLSRTLGIGRTEAGEFIDRYHKRFPKIHEFLDTCIHNARENGYVETICRRRRPIPEIDSRNPSRRAAAAREALNTVVQGSAADLIKLAMINLQKRIEAENRPSKIMLQIHDELVLEVPQQRIESERKIVVEEMLNAIKLDVPLKVDTGIGANWMEAK